MGCTVHCVPGPMDALNIQGVCTKAPGRQGERVRVCEGVGGFKKSDLLKFHGLRT